jgi:hypothetical protein
MRNIRLCLSQTQQQRVYLTALGLCKIVYLCFFLLFLSCSVKMSTSSSTSFGGLPTVMDYHMNRKEEDVVDSNFVHERYTPAHGGRHKDALVVATPHQVFSLNQASSSGDEL